MKNQKLFVHMPERVTRRTHRHRTIKVYLVSVVLLATSGQLAREAEGRAIFRLPTASRLNSAMSASTLFVPCTALSRVRTLTVLLAASWASDRETSSSPRAQSQKLTGQTLVS